MTAVRTCLVLLILPVVATSTTPNVAAPPPRDWSAYPMEPGRFDGTWQSLDAYECPEWFRDAKFDIVSKNGNLLLNLPLHPEGTLDEKEIAFLAAMGRWMAVNGEGIYGTRPWVVSGEGPAKGGGGHFNEAATRFTARDFRFTSKGETQLFAFFMKWPADRRLNVRAVAKNAQVGGVIEQVELLGHDGPLSFTHTDTGLAVQLPDTPPCEHAWALRISGQRLCSFLPQKTTDTIGLLDLKPKHYAE